MKIKDSRRILEIIAVILTGVGKFIFMDWLNVRFLYITVAILFWVGYIIFRYRQDKSILKYWGLNKQNFKKSFLELLPFAIVLVFSFVLIGNSLGTNVLNWTILPILLLYPLWGIIQQFIMIGVLAKNIKEMESIHVPDLFIVLITAIIFSLVHYPFTLLIIGTFFLAIVYTILYLNKRNLIVMGIYHGWIGAFFFYTMLSRNPYDEVFRLL